MKIKTNLAKRSNYGDKRPLSYIKYIVIHYTGNDGDMDESNGNYFKNNQVGASAHYFVDDDSVTQSVPDDYIAWHCGASKYKHAKCRNTNSIGIEICDDVRNGKIYPSKKTIENVLELTYTLMNKYNVPKENVIRHYDVTGKICPAYWCGSTTKNKKWKTEFWNKLQDIEKEFKPYTVTINTKVLNVRKGASTSTPIVTTVKQGQVYTIVEEKNGWGRLKSGVGWIKLSYTVK